jgi:hypothetical protein
LIFTEDAQEQAQHPAAQNNAAASTADEWRTDFLFEFWAGGAPGGKVAREYLCDHVMMSPNNTYAGMLPACSLDSLVVCVLIPWYCWFVLCRGSHNRRYEACGLR